MSSTRAGNKAFAGKLNGNSRSTTKSTKTPRLHPHPAFHSFANRYSKFIAVWLPDFRRIANAI
jgi:hypothetical protein